MFTGIVEELGEVLALEPARSPPRSPCSAPGVGRDVSLGASIAVDGVCLTVIGRPARTAGPVPALRRHGRDAAPQHPRPVAAGRRGQPGARGARRRATGRPHRPGHVDGVAVVTSRQPGDGWGDGALRPARRPGPLRRGEGVGGRRRSVADRDRGGPDLVRGRADPRDAAPHHLGPATGRAPVNLEVDVLAKYTERLLDFAAVPAGMPLTGRRPDDVTRRKRRSALPREPRDDPRWLRSGSTPSRRAIADIAAGKAVVVVDDADRENEGDLIFAAELATPGADGVHGPVHVGLHLRADHRGGRRPARPAADVPRQPGPARHRLHRHGGRAARA